MEKLLNFRAKERIVISFLLIIATIVLTLLLAYTSIKKINNANNQLTELDSYIYTIGTFRADFNRSRALSLAMILEKNPIERLKIKDLVLNEQTKMLEKITQIKEAIQGFPDLLRSFEKKTELLSQYITAREEYNNLLDRGNTDEAVLYVNTVLSPMYDNMNNEIIDTEISLIKEKNKLSDITLSLRKKIMYQSLVMGLFLIILTVFIFIYLMGMLRKISREIRGGIEIIANSSQDILSTITEMSTGASETAASVSETTATVEEVRQTAAVANKKAQSLLESTKRVKSSAEQGQVSLEQVIDGMEKIDIQMKKISTTVLKLSDQNRRIGEITASVADIADQSNLLAVNAAIEAAKAGEHGRGFTVVAQEIRNLSNQSKRATLQVKEILNEIEKSVNDTVGVTEESKKTVESGKILVSQSSEVIDILAGNIEETADSAMQISSSNHQQMAGMDQIVPAMENIKKASEQNAEGIRQAQNATRELHSLGQSLNNVLLKFNL